MGLLNKISGLSQRWLDKYRFDDPHASAHGLRICRFEEVESRRLMTADVHVGATYFDPHSGMDTVPNVFEVEFQGGADGTQLTHLRIDGSKNGGPLFFNDAIFDTAAGGLGAYGFSPLSITAHAGFQITGSQVVDGGTSLDLYFQGFQAGMKLVFTIDLDQVINTNPVTVDAIVEGAEFEGAHLDADFSAPHFQDLNVSTKFWDVYDANFSAADQQSGTALDLPSDHYANYTDPPSDQWVYTDGAVAVAAQVALPASISGVVYYDNNVNNQQDSGDPGIGGVNLALEQFNGAQYVSTGLTTVTDPQGAYKFGNLSPGQYRVVKTSPAGYLDEGAQAGNVGGQIRGGVTSPDIISDITLLGGDDSVQNDFSELLPNSISGHVGNDVTGNCETNPNTPGIAGVVIHLLDGSGHVLQTTTTDSSGNYQFVNLAPGSYTVLEDQPAGWLEDDAHAGSAGGVVVSDDEVAQISLTTNIQGVKYNFCEVLPVSIAGHVGIDTVGGQKANSDMPPIAGVTIQLLDSTGKVVATTTTDASGNYHFSGLQPGTFEVHEIQPAGYLDGDTEAGSQGGTVSDDLIANIVLTSGMQATDYDFSEILAAELCGTVYLDRNNNGRLDPSEPGIVHVTIELKDAGGHIVATQTTAADGSYCFTGLLSGTYTVVEVRPTGYMDGSDTVGTAGGIDHPNRTISNIVLTPGVDGEDYDFGELLPATIGGHVGVATPNECGTPNTPPIAGVTIQLLDANGHVIATTLTDASGNYTFIDLTPGTYEVHEVQPVGYFDGDTHAGTAGGTVSDDLVTDIVLAVGVMGDGYDFCEIAPSSLSGFVFQDGPPILLQNAGDVPNVLAVRDGKLAAGDVMLPGVTLELRDGVTGQPIFGSAALPGAYPPNQPITTVTDQNGHYSFAGLPPGNYAVYDIKPGGYSSGIDTPGSLGGWLDSKLIVNNPAGVALLTAPPQDDAILGIVLANQSDSVMNNFSVVTTTSTVQPFVFPSQAASASPAGLAYLAPTNAPFLPPVVSYPFLVQQIVRMTGSDLYTWHLSVVDAGQPRDLESAGPAVQLTTVGPDDEAFWDEGDLAAGDWVLTFGARGDGQPTGRRLRFGVRDAIPIVGDFNGDGKTEVGIFKNGKWFIDLNDNGVWDEGDLWARLGRKGDRPVTGDWDGDGKTDIGIYGPAWLGDPRAVAHEPGLPDPHNENTNVRKNIPRPPQQTTLGERKMKLRADGKQRSDVIDHVFLYGSQGDHPVVGDWNGDGIDTIAVFRNGNWHRDVDGDGKLSPADAHTRFGQSGDVPVVGDFNGDGTDELGVFRNGTWYIDINANGKIDADDQVFQLGRAGDKPIVGDFNGDGTADPGVYHDASGPAAQTARTEK